MEILKTFVIIIIGIISAMIKNNKAVEVREEDTSYEGGENKFILWLKEACEVREIAGYRYYYYKLPKPIEEVLSREERTLDDLFSKELYSSCGAFVYRDDNSIFVSSLIADDTIEAVVLHEVGHIVNNQRKVTTWSDKVYNEIQADCMATKNNKNNARLLLKHLVFNSKFGTEEFNDNLRNTVMPYFGRYVKLFLASI